MALKEITAELLQKLATTAGFALSPEHATDMAANFNGLLTIEQRLAVLEEAVAAEQERHHTKLGDFAAERQALQSQCSHPVTKYVPDPSGNNDTYYYCQTCGKNFKNKPN